MERLPPPPARLLDVGVGLYPDSKSWKVAEQDGVKVMRTDEAAELHLPEDAEVEVVETNRGGKSTFHGPGQLVCYPILDLRRHGKDVKKYVRDLEEALIRTMAPLGVEATRIEGLTGVPVHIECLGLPA